jgi:hypothetical protein
VAKITHSKATAAASGQVNGAPIAEQDAKTIVNYLASAYGPTK